MPFKPKLIGSEPAPLDDQGEIELPAELGRLAGHLRQDADRVWREGKLSRGGQTGASPEASARRFASRVVFAVVATLALVFVVPGINRLFPGGSDRTDTSETHQAGIRSSGAAPNRANSLQDSKTLQADRPVLTLPVSDTADGFLRDVTGPELEGLLDLLENDSDSALPSVSI